MYAFVNSLKKSDNVLHEFLLIKHQSLASSIDNASKFSRMSLLLIWYPLLNILRSSKKICWAVLFVVSAFEWLITHYLKRGLGHAKGKVFCWHYIGLPAKVWLTYYKSLLGDFYFDLSFLRLPMVHYRLYENFCCCSLFYCREFPIVRVLIYEVPFFPWIGLIVYSLLLFCFQNFPLPTFHSF